MFCAPDDGRKTRLEHVERLTEINIFEKSCILLVALWEQIATMFVVGKSRVSGSNVGSSGCGL